MFISFFFAIRLFWTFLMWIRSGTSIECTADVGMFHHPDIISSLADHLHDSNTKQYKKETPRKDRKNRKFRLQTAKVYVINSRNCSTFFIQYASLLFLCNIFFYRHCFLSSRASKRRKRGGGWVFYWENVKNEK